MSAGSFRAAALTLAARTHSAGVSRPLTEVTDKNAHFESKDTPGGSTVKVRYSRY